MEGPDYPPPNMGSYRPSIGFPLGVALLLIVIFSLSGVLSCYYHWDKLRSLRRSSDALDPEADTQLDIPAAKLALMKSKRDQNQSLPVLMPGDRVPKFVALTCPREPPAGWMEKTDVLGKKQPPPFVAVPFY